MHSVLDYGVGVGVVEVVCTSSSSCLDDGIVESKVAVDCEAVFLQIFDYISGGR